MNAPGGKREKAVEEDQAAKAIQAKHRAAKKRQQRRKEKERDAKEGKVEEKNKGISFGKSGSFREATSRLFRCCRRNPSASAGASKVSFRGDTVLDLSASKPRRRDVGVRARHVSEVAGYAAYLDANTFYKKS